MRTNDIKVLFLMQIVIYVIISWIYDKNTKLEIDPSFPEFKKSEKKYKLYQDYETDFESEWMKINLYQQKELGNQVKEMISRLNSILNTSEVWWVYKVK